MKFLTMLQIITILALTENGFSQDVITLLNGEEVISKVVEIGEFEIKFKKYSNLDGPIYAISKLEVFMIKYENGDTIVLYESNDISDQQAVQDRSHYLKMYRRSYFKGGKKISQKELAIIIEGDPIAYKQYYSGKNLATTGSVIGIIGIAVALIILIIGSFRTKQE